MKIAVPVKITKVINYITSGNNLIPVLDESLRHFSCVRKWSLKVYAMTFIAEMGVSREKDIWHSLILVRVTRPISCVWGRGVLEGTPLAWPFTPNQPTTNRFR